MPINKIVKNQPFHLLLKPYWGMAVILSASFAVKVAIRLFLSRNVNFWETGYTFYYRIAKNLLLEGEYYLQGAYNLYSADKLYAARVPLYPLFIAAIGKMTHFSVIAFILAQALISTLTAAVAYNITLKLEHPKAALCAMTLCAFYPYSLFHDTQLQESGLYSFLSLMSVWLFLVAAEKKRSSLFFAAGFCLGVATLARVSHLVHAALLIAWILFFFRKEFKRALLYVVVMTLGLTISLSPWLIRNKKVIGSFTLTSMTGGALATAHNEFSFVYYPYTASIDDSMRHFRSQSIQEGNAYPAALGQNERAQSEWYGARAVEYIRRHKLQTLGRGVYKATVNFLGILSPLEHPLENTAYFLSYWVLTLLAVIGMPKVWRTAYFQIFIILSLSQAVFSFIFWTHSSHRSFLDPMLAVLGGVGLSLLLFQEEKSLVQRIFGRSGA